MNLSGDETLNLSSSSDNNAMNNMTPPKEKENKEKAFLIHDISKIAMDSIKDINKNEESLFQKNIMKNSNDNISFDKKENKASHFKSYFSRKRE